jgi:hypothetical protein
VAKQALEIADPRILVENIALIDLHGVVRLGLKKMGFEKEDSILEEVAVLDPKG